MAKKKSKGRLPQFEIIIVAVFIFSFLIWAGSKFTNRVVDKPTQNHMSRADESINDKDKLIYDTVAIVKRELVSRLYVTIEGLKLRDTIGLSALVLDTLDLYDELEFLGEVTDSLYTINLGLRVVDEPWVKVKSVSGKMGWVYGAGVDYYRHKRRGVR